MIRRSNLTGRRVAVATAALAFVISGCGATSFHGSTVQQQNKPRQSPQRLAFAASVARTRLARVRCTRFVGVNGRDTWPGTLQQPYHSVQKLVDSLGPGQTGCLLAGTFTEDVSFHSGGSPGRPLTLAASPGNHPVLRGALWISGGADYVTVRGLRLDGVSPSGVPSPQVNGSHATFYGDDVTNDHTAICFVLGGSGETYGMPTGTVISHSRIHGCGKLPPTHFDHGIYVAHSRGAVIADNYVYDNADWGLHLYPDAQGTVVAYNVFDGNGDGALIGGTGSFASSGNTIVRNIFSNTTDGSSLHLPGNNYGFQVTSFWGGAVGSSNLVIGNCFWNGISGDVNTNNGGFTLSENIVADPEYVSRAKKDFRLKSGSRCAGDGPR